MSMKTHREYEQEIAYTAIEWRRWETQYEFERKSDGIMDDDGGPIVENPSKKAERLQYLDQKRQEVYEQLCSLINEFCWQLNTTK